jgi:FkbM family methyltransferase
MVDAATPESYTFTLVELNGQELWLPDETLRTMRHCAQETGGRLSISVERAHFEWMRARLAPGMHFLDVGAATGAICLPLAKEFGAALSITAFEPARPARALLAATCARNDLSIDISPLACSDRLGQAPFFEWPNDETGIIPWLPESATLANPEFVRTIESAAAVKAIETTVGLTTLDAQFSSLAPPVRAVIKIDVEGHEAKVLRGGLKLLTRLRPLLAIDIHVEGTGTTENAVRAILAPLGYTFEKLGHVLACSP